MTFLERTWAFLTDPAHRELLAWLGGGLAVLLGGAWAVFTYLRPSPTAKEAESKSAAVTANRGVAAGRDIKGSPVNISGSPRPGGPPRQHRAGAGKPGRRKKGGKRR
jgi:hypothetical protein